MLFASGPGLAAQVDYAADDRAATISLVGEIVDGDAAAVKRAIGDAVSGGSGPIEIRLNSIGGNVHEGVNIVRMVHAAHLNTTVTRGATCASICFLAFAAGERKTVDCLARIGVHVASEEAGEEDAASIRGTAALAHIALTLDVPTNIIQRMVSTPPDTMFWLSRSDLQSMGAVIAGEG